jgi:hypothetical protein
MKLYTYTVAAESKDAKPGTTRLFTLDSLGRSVFACYIQKVHHNVVIRLGLQNRYLTRRLPTILKIKHIFCLKAAP